MTDQEKLKSALHYEPITGIFTRLRNWETAGYIRRNVRWVIAIRVREIKDNFQFTAHRLAWLYMTGDWPKCEIDHINGNSLDNRWENLRDISHSENLQNLRKARKDNATGFLGVRKVRYGFKARIRVNQKLIELGLFHTPELAHAAYVLAKRKLHPGGML